MCTPSPLSLAPVHPFIMVWYPYGFDLSKPTNLSLKCILQFLFLFSSAFLRRHINNSTKKKNLYFYISFVRTSLAVLVQKYKFEWSHFCACRTRPYLRGGLWGPDLPPAEMFSTMESRRMLSHYTYWEQILIDYYFFWTSPEKKF